MEKEAIREELNKVREEIKKIKSDFSDKKSQKEEFFTQGEKFSEEINSLYEEVKQIEVENNLDKINEDLEAKKVDLDKYNSEVKELEKSLEESKKKSGGFTGNNSDRPTIKTVSVDKAKKEITKLDLKLQTQVLSLEKESEVIKKIAELKDLVDSHSNKKSPSSDFKKVLKDLKAMRKKYINTERKIRSLYKQIRLISKEKKKKYKRIDELRDMKKEAFENFRKNKKEYSTYSKDLRSLFKKEEDFLTKLGESPVQKKKKVEKNIKIKQKEVEEKLMKKGQKLTTEDLLMFQK